MLKLPIKVCKGLFLRKKSVIYINMPSMTT